MRLLHAGASRDYRGRAYQAPATNLFRHIPPYPANRQKALKMPGSRVRLPPFPPIYGSNFFPSSPLLSECLAREAAFRSSDVCLTILSHGSYGNYSSYKRACGAARAGVETIGWTARRVIREQLEKARESGARPPVMRLAAGVRGVRDPLDAHGVFRPVKGNAAIAYRPDGRKSRRPGRRTR